MAKGRDFENCCFVLFFAIVLEHVPSQESPKTEKQPPKMASKGQQEPFKKEIHFLRSFLPQKLFQKGFKSSSKSDRKNAPQHIQK